MPGAFLPYVRKRLSRPGLGPGDPLEVRVELRFVLARLGRLCGLNEATLLLLGRQLLGAELPGRSFGLSYVCGHLASVPCLGDFADKATAGSRMRGARGSQHPTAASEGGWRLSVGLVPTVYLNIQLNPKNKSGFPGLKSDQYDVRMRT